MGWFGVRCLLLVDACLWFVVCLCLLFIVGCGLFDDCCLQFVVRSVLLVIRMLLLVV